MTLAQLHCPPPCFSEAFSSRTGRAPTVSSGAPVSLGHQQFCGGHIGDNRFRFSVLQGRVFPTCAVTSDFQGFAAVRFGMNSDGEYKGVLVSGTFDRLHPGHTHLLTKALSLVGQGGSLLVGIANGQLLSQNSLSELIEPYHTRVGVVQQCLKELAESHGQSVEFRCLEFEEAVPRGVVLDLQLDCIVVGQETEVYAETFNKCRVSEGLPPLKAVIVAAVMNEESQGVKFSSSSLRRQALGTYIHRQKGERLSDGSLVTGPYLVGLTGGIAAGKSFVRELLKEKGAFVLDCDALGHLSYIPGTPTYQAMIAAFGPSIIKPVDGQIDRQILGSIVFTDPAQMEVLKRIVWVSVAHLVAEKREKVAEQGGQIFFAEAALMLEAHWEKEWHEIWVVFAPQDVSRRRLMARNNITEEEANKRIGSQMSTEKRVSLADVVICNGWTKEETKEQVEKAWQLLLQRVAARPSQEKSEDPLWFRWTGLMRRLCVNEEVALKWWPRLKSSYSEPWRHYHTFKHLQALYDQFHEFAHFIAEPHIVQLAIFFHRVVYHPSGVNSNQNELSSAASFDEFSTEAALQATDIETVKHFVLRCRRDVSPEATVSGDLAFFLDFNLAVLGSSPKEYLEYKARARQECENYDDEQFQTSFKNQLQPLISRTQIFHTKPFQLKYFTAAQANLCGDDSLKSLTVS